MRYARYVIVVLLLVLSASYQAYGQEARQSGKPADPAPTEKLFTATIGPDGIQHVEIVGGEYYFEPNHIVVKVNTPVELKVKKAGFVPHKIIVKAPEAGIDFKVDLVSDWKTISFTPTKTGTYEMICDRKLLWFKSHKDRGMVGTIEVVE